MAIAPGGDVVNPSFQTIIGIYIAEVSFPGNSLRLLDIDAPDHQRVRDSFEKQNIPTQVINPKNLAQVEQVLKQLSLFCNCRKILVVTDF